MLFLTDLTVVQSAAVRPVQTKRDWAVPPAWPAGEQGETGETLTGCEGHHRLTITSRRAARYKYCGRPVSGTVNLQKLSRRYLAAP